MEMYCFLSFPFIAALANPAQQRERTPENIHNSLHSIHNPAQRRERTPENIHSIHNSAQQRESFHDSHVLKLLSL